MRTNDPNVNKLNSLLAGELAAYATYQSARERVDDDLILEQLIECELSHKHRAQSLRECIEDLGAVPNEECTMWASFAILSHDAEKSHGDKDTVRALEGEEDLHLKMYQQEVESADSSVRELMLEKLLPAQEYTSEALSILKISLQ